MALGVRRLRRFLDTPPLERVAGLAGAELICLACGAALAPTLANTGALRCHDCRSSEAPLDRALLDLQQVLSGRRMRSD